MILLKRQIIGNVRFINRCFFIGRLINVRSLCGCGSLVIRSFAKKLHDISNNFGGISFVFVFIIPGAGTKFSLNVNLTAFFNIFFSNLSQVLSTEPHYAIRWL